MPDVEINMGYYDEDPLQETPKDYIARMARNSVISIQGQSQGADAIYEGLSKLEDDGKTWSTAYLRKEFDRTNIEANYVKFHRRLNHAALKRYLQMQMGISILAIIFFLGMNPDDLLRPLADVIMHIVLFSVSLVIFLIALRERIAQSIPYFYTFVAIFLPMLLLGLDIGLQAYHKFYVPPDQKGVPLPIKVHVPWAFCVITVVYSFMPLRRDWVAVFMGGFISASYLIFSGVVVYSDDSYIIQRLFADGVYYLCINCLGVVSRFLTEIILRRSFADRRSCVESRFRLDYEKEQEEALLLSIIPKHIAKEVSDDLREAIADVTVGDDSDSDDDEKELLKKKKAHSSPFARENNQSDKLAPYSKDYDMVSILFADIVNFTPLTTTLKVKDLVAMLNDLFAQFDDAAERNNCLRIKILGDCYYCVSGIPEATADHAINCVKMGLDMIGIIAAVRMERNVNVDMRIGVHSGKVISGLLGIRKWQFDVWSTDTTIANKMEQSGRPGRVHVTGQTLGNLRGMFEYEPSDGADKEPYLKERNIKTYLIVAEPPTEKFIKEVLDATPTITLLTTELKKLSFGDEYADSDGYEYSSDDSGESGFEEEKELTERRLRKHYKVFPPEYIATVQENDSSDQEEVKASISNSGIVPSDSEQKDSISIQNPANDSDNASGVPVGKQGKLYEKRANATGGGVVKKINDRANSAVVPRRRSTATNNADPGAPQGRDRRAASSTKSLADYSHLRARTDDYMKNVIDTMPISHSTKSGSQQLDSRTLMFQNRRWEKTYTMQADPLFKYSHVCSVLILVSIMTIQTIIAPNGSPIFWPIFAVSFVGLLSVIPFTFMDQIWMNLKDPKREADYIPPPGNDQPAFKFLYTNGKKIVQSFTIRTVILICASCMVSVLAIVEVAECTDISGDNSSSQIYEINLCRYPWYFTFCCSLALASINIFVRSHFGVKFLLYSINFAVYASVILDLKRDIFRQSASTDEYTGTPALHEQSEAAHVMYLAVVVIVLHVIDRKDEFVHRLDYVLKKQLKKEQILANQTRLVNKVLLQNILPEHVAKVYLSEGRTEDELYHETHPSVAVMFASIPNFADFWELNGEKDEHNGGVGALKVLNSIVAEFDGLFFDQRFTCIEKIKVIGSTYMAVCGLSLSGSPGRKGAIMVDFAREMAKKLKQVTSEAVNTMELRVGIECGPVIAGVVGRTKPLYDIWGDTVNMASRMDYTGQPGRIHVTENTAKLLMQEGIHCEKRGVTYVKGKGEIVTYWVPQTDKYPLSVNLPVIEESKDRSDDDSEDDTKSVTSDEYETEL